MPLARFPKQRVSRFWELWDNFAAQSGSMIKPVLLPTEPMARLFLVDDAFGEYLNRRKFFDGDGTAAAG